LIDASKLPGLMHALSESQSPTLHFPGGIAV